MASTNIDPTVRFVTLDVFTKERFRGNPLAIVEIPEGTKLDQEVKQRLAREFNLSETVFLHAPSSEGAKFQRRCDIFTTTEELPFAGHPTIGTLVYLCQGEKAPSESQPVTLQTKAGPINASFEHSSGIAKASIPHNVRIHEKPVPLKSVLEAQPPLTSLEGGLGASFPLVSIVKGMTFVLIELPRLEDLAQLVVGGHGLDPQAVQWDEGWASFTATYFFTKKKAARHSCIRSRMIVPGFGEDAATGSAASALAAYLALQSGVGGATYSYSIEQGVEMGRQSEIGVRVTLSEDARSVSSVTLSGCAIVVSQGTLTI